MYNICFKEDRQFIEATSSKKKLLFKLSFKTNLLYRVSTRKTRKTEKLWFKHKLLVYFL